MQRLCLCRFSVQVIGGIYACLAEMQDGFDLPMRRVVIHGEILLHWLRKQRIPCTLHVETKLLQLDGAWRTCSQLRCRRLTGIIRNTIVKNSMLAALLWSEQAGMWGATD
jgi:hypothetical protein